MRLWNPWYHKNVCYYLTNLMNKACAGLLEYFCKAPVNTCQINLWPTKMYSTNIERSLCFHGPTSSFNLTHHFTFLSTSVTFSLKWGSTLDGSFCYKECVTPLASVHVNTAIIQTNNITYIPTYIIVKKKFFDLKGNVIAWLINT